MFNQLRFTGWIYLAAAAGINLPGLIIKILNNKKTLNTKNNYKKGIAFTRVAEEVICTEEVLDKLYDLKKPLKISNRGGVIQLEKA